MVQILPAVDRGPSLGQRLSGGFGRALEAGQQAYSKHKTGQALQRMTGEDLSDLDPEMQKAILVAHLQGQNEINKQKMKSQQKNEFYKMLGLDVSGEGQPQSEPNRFAQSMQEPITQEQAHQESFMGEQVPQGKQMPKGQQQSPQKQRDAQSWYNSLNDQQRSLLALENPSAANALENGRKFNQTQDLAERKFTEKQKADAEKQKIDAERIAREEQIKFHQESAKYDETLIDKTRIAKNQINTIKDIEKAIASGNVKPASWANVLKEFGPIGELAAKAFLKGDEATLQASIPSLLEGWKEVFGVRLSDADLKLLGDKLPDIGKTPEANRAITNILKKYADQTLLRSKIAADIKKNNKNLRPLGYANLIEERYDEMTKPVMVVNPNTGKTVPIPAYQLSAALEKGAVLADE